MNTKSAEKRGGSIKRALIWAGVAFALFLLTFFAFVFLKPLAGDYRFGSIVVSQAGALVCIGVCLCLGGYWLATGKYTHARALGLLFVIGYILRLAYALYSPAVARQHDTFSVNHDGHEAYAWTIFVTGKLPTTNAYQFYHPPFNALIQAGLMKFFSIFTSVGWLDPSAYAYGKPEYIATERYFLFSACQILSVFYSCVTCLASVGIIRKLRLSKRAQTLACAFVILYPRNIQFAGMLNNDPLAYAFAIIALYFALKWWKDGRSLLDILLCATAVGAGMASKLSCASVCLPIAGIFLWEMIVTLRKKENALPFKKLVLQYGLFLLLAAPIGLWFQVYAKIRFDQPFGFVFSNLNPDLYTGDKSVLARFFLCFDVGEYFGTLWCRPFENYYLFHYALRSSLFGEFAYARGAEVGVATLLFAYALVFALLLAVIYRAFYAWKHARKNRSENAFVADTVAWKDGFFVALLLFSQVIAEVYFYAKMPYGCTMDFRYIMPIVTAVALVIGRTVSALSACATKTAKGIEAVLLLVTVAFLGFASAFYCICG